MIFGIGTDIVEIERVARALDRHGERFARRVLNDLEWGEFQRCSRAAAFMAKRFAAKEAAAKALGTGFRDGLSMRDIAVSHSPLGQPRLNFQGRAAGLCQTLGVGESHLSLADERRYAVAFVTLLQRQGGERGHSA